MLTEDYNSYPTRDMCVQQLQHSDSLIVGTQQLINAYNFYQDNYTLSCHALTPLTVKQMQLLAIGTVDKSDAGMKAFICHFLACGETELLTLNEFSILLFAQNLCK